MAKRAKAEAVRTPGDANGTLSTADMLVRTFNDLRDELISTLLYVLGDKDDAQDAAQEAFLKCWGARASLGEVVNLRAWIFRVGFNTAKDMQRSAWNRRVIPLVAEEYTMVGREPAPAQVLEKEVFLLRQNGDLTYEQIAEMRRCPVGTVKTQMRSALEKLRKVLV